MIISLEGLGVTCKERFTQHLVTHKPDDFGRVICCPSIYPRFNPEAFKGWVYAITRSTELWREATSHQPELITLFENSPFSISCYVQALAEPFGDIGQQEYELISDIIEGLSELMTPPDIIVLFEPDFNKVNNYHGLPKTYLVHTHRLLVEWAEKHTAKVVYLPSYEKEADWELWYNQNLKKIMDTVEVTA